MPIHWQGRNRRAPALPEPPPKPTKTQQLSGHYPVPPALEDVIEALGTKMMTPLIWGTLPPGYVLPAFPYFLIHKRAPGPKFRKQLMQAIDRVVERGYDDQLVSTQAEAQNRSSSMGSDKKQATRSLRARRGLRTDQRR